jgi:hypothetical protein
MPSEHFKAKIRAISGLFCPIFVVIRQWQNSPRTDQIQNHCSTTLTGRMGADADLTTRRFRNLKSEILYPVSRSTGRR